MTRIDPAGPVTLDQASIVEKAGDVLDALDAVVPDSTVHYAVEEARRALRVLIREAHGVKTNDRKA